MTKSFNKALLARQWWCIIYLEQSLLSKVMRTKYYHKTHPIMIYNGQHVRVWKEQWIQKMMDNMLIVEPNKMVNENLYVADLINPNFRRWNMQVLTKHFSTSKQQLISTITLRHHFHLNTLFWRENAHGYYVVKSGYKVSQAIWESHIACPS
uniref:Uncharacterized protein n=1 Tax=Cajanus cajan TaxID=3821 RepID=A0A151RUJ2_CAJCA|nr:hypothetical protein KK1_032197 [Cajanus cajan]